MFRISTIIRHNLFRSGEVWGPRWLSCFTLFIKEWRKLFISLNTSEWLPLRADMTERRENCSYRSRTSWRRYWRRKKEWDFRSLKVQCSMNHWIGELSSKSKTKAWGEKSGRRRRARRNTCSRSKFTMNCSLTVLIFRKLETSKVRDEIALKVRGCTGGLYLSKRYRISFIYWSNWDQTYMAFSPRLPCPAPANW